jgi:hypothetical protein
MAAPIRHARNFDVAMKFTICDRNVKASRMKTLLIRLIPLVILSFLLADPASGGVRTMANLPGLPVAGLRAYLPQGDYERLINAPIKAWIVVRGQVVNNKVFGARVIRSEGNGVYDKISVQMADGMELYSFETGSRLHASVLVHILIYQLPKGEHAFALAQNDSVGDANLIYSRSIKLRYLGLAGAKPEKKKPSR